MAPDPILNEDTGWDGLAGHGLESQGEEAAQRATRRSISNSMAGKGRSTCCSNWRGGRRSTCGGFRSSNWSTSILTMLHAGALRLELAADYLVMAAWLAYLKSLLLLPRDPAMQPGPEELALRLQLRLQRLGAMREAGARLMARDRLGRDVFARGAPEGIVIARRPRWKADLFALIQAYGQVQHRNRPVVHMVRERPVMTLEAALARISAMLGTSLEWRDLRAFLPASTLDSLEARQLARSALASSFLAVLELAKQGLVDLVQEECFGPLLVRPR
jgi:segregation and condensation protein A